MLQSSRVEWLREGDPFDSTGDVEDEELRDRLLEVGAVRPSPKGGLAIRFVGLLVFRARTIVALPKVRVKGSNLEVHREVMRALRTYAKWTPEYHEPSPHLNCSPDRGQVSGLASTDWLMNDFLVHGLYRRTQVDFEVNGAGKVNWAATIGKMRPLFSRGRPVYVETITRRSENDPGNFATMLHLHLLEHLSAEFGPLLDYEPLRLDHEAVDRFEALPSVDECERRLVAEMRVTYSERGLELLAMLLATVKALEVERARGLSLYGTSSFHHVWEAACGTVFGNAVREWSSLLPSPLWTALDGSSAMAETFVPDVVIALGGDDGRLLIADAKYYRPMMPPHLGGVPGVNDVAKQIWYKQHLMQAARERGYAKVENVFLFPADGALVERIGQVEFPPGKEKVDVVNVDFTSALRVYSSGGREGQQIWRERLARVLTDVEPASTSI